MKFSFITPTAYIKDFGSQSDFILALSHLIDLETENEYEKAIKATGLPIYLDNGLFENKVSEGFETLLMKAVKIGAKIVFAPDSLYNAQETRENINLMWNLVKNTDVKMAAVVQASSSEEWVELYDEFVKDERISLIGLSILAIPHVFGNSIVGARIRCLETIKDRPSKNCHLLGAGEGFEDSLYAKFNCSFVKSQDSSSAFWNAMQGKRIVDLMSGSLRVEGGKTKVPVDFNFTGATNEQLQLAQDNINLLKERICK